MRAALDHSPGAVIITDANGVIRWVNAEFNAITGYTPEEAAGQTLRLLKSGKQNAAFYSAMWSAILSGACWRGEIVNRRKDGGYYLADETIYPVTDPSSGSTYFVATQLEATERRRAEEALRRRERDLKEAQRLAGVGTFEWNTETDEVTWSEEQYRLVGLDPHLPVPPFKEQASFFTAGSWVRINAAAAEMLATGTPSEVGLQGIRADGQVRWMVVRGEPVRDSNGRITAIRGTVQDMTERKRVEDSLRNTDSALSALLNATTEFVLLLDPSGKVLVANETVAARLNTTVEAMTGTCIFDLLPAELASSRRRCVQQVIDERMPVRFCDLHGDMAIESCVYPIPDENGEITRVAMYGRDVTEARRAEQTLRESERRFRDLLENVGIAAVIVDRHWKIVFCNDHLLHLTGWSREELIGNSWLERCIPPRERENLKALFRGAATGRFPLHYGNRILTKGGTERWIEWDNSPLKTPDGKLAGTASLGRDLTEQRTLEEQLRQSQKLEAVGRLAGGVAHDFNNLLTVISGYTELLLAARRRGDPSRVQLEAIQTASERAIELVRQLLAFSRKQLLQPKVLDVSAILKDSLKMLRRLIGEDIEMTCRTDPGLSPIEADPGQIHQIIMNLALNARDSMPNGGRLTIEAANSVLDEAYAGCHPDVRPGAYVRLAFTDTGHGMDETTREHIFEPFFTTKEVGKGTGLGLSTVYGSVKQSGGHTTVSSEVGRGTTFEVYLPAVERKRKKPRRNRPHAPANC